MKYLKKFEELSPDIFTKAADKLAYKLGHTKRVKDLYDHADSYKDKKKSVAPKKDYTYNIILSDTNEKANANLVNTRVTFFMDSEDIESTDVDNVVKTYIDNSARELSFELDFEFEIKVDGDGPSHYGYTLDNTLLISLAVYIYNHKSKFKPNIIFNNDEITNSLFSDRRSANLFRKVIKDEISKIDISTILTTTEPDSNHTNQLEEFYNMLDNIDIHKLYSPTPLYDYDTLSGLSIIDKKFLNRINDN